MKKVLFNSVFINGKKYPISSTDTYKQSCKKTRQAIEINYAKVIDLTCYGIRKAKRLMLEYKANSNQALRFLLPQKSKPKFKPSNFKFDAIFLKKHK